MRIVGELRKLRIDVSATLVRSVLAGAGLPPAPQRDRMSWRSFVRTHGETLAVTTASIGRIARSICKRLTRSAQRSLEATLLRR